jgi:antitoxin HicB
MRYTYPAIFTPVKRGYVVTIPDIPEVVTEGNTVEEATEYATDAIQLGLAEYIRRKSEIPRPSKPGGKHVRMVELRLLTQAKLSLYTAMRGAGVRKADLARRLGISKPQVERLLDLGHGSNLHQVERAFRALKKRLELSVKDAA